MIKEYITEGKIVPMEVTVKVGNLTALTGRCADSRLAARERHARDPQEPPEFLIGLSAIKLLDRWKGQIPDRRVPQENGPSYQV